MDKPESHSGYLLSEITKNKKVFKKSYRPVQATRIDWVDNPFYDELKSAYVGHPYIAEKRVSCRTKKIQKPVEFIGFFHAWGSQTEDNDCGIGTDTMGIVEDEKGRVFLVLPHRIRFLDGSE